MMQVVNKIVASYSKYDDTLRRKFMKKKKNGWQTDGYVIKQHP